MTIENPNTLQPSQCAALHFLNDDERNVWRHTVSDRLMHGRSMSEAIEDADTYIRAQRERGTQP